MVFIGIQNSPASFHTVSLCANAFHTAFVGSSLSGIVRFWAYGSAIFTVDEITAEAIRRAVDESGELAGVVELRRHFPLISDNEGARRCVRVIAG